MKMNYVQKIVLLILLIGTSFFIGYTFGHGYVGIESVESYVLSILGVLAEVVVLFRLDRAGYDLEEKKQRNFDSDHELFQEIIGFLPESLMAYFSSACPEICINNASISTLCEFEEIYQGKVLKTFHDKRMKKKYDAFFLL